MALTKPTKQIEKDVVVDTKTGKKQRLYFQPYITYEKSRSQATPGVGPVPARVFTDSANIILKYYPEPGSLITAATLTKTGWKFQKDSNGKFILGEGARRALLETGPNNLTSDIKKRAAETLRSEESLSEQEANSVIQKSFGGSKPFPNAKADPLNGANTVDRAANQDPNAESANNVGLNTSGSLAEAAPIDLDRKAFEEENVTRSGTREKYEDIFYPEKIELTKQDCIKFSIVRYQPPGLAGFGESEAGSRVVGIQGTSFQNSKRTSLGTITLPIPGGVRDSNSVSWNSGSINPLEQEASNIVTSVLSGKEPGKVLDEAAEKVKNSATQIRTSIIGWAAQSAVGANNIMQREFGSIINPNLELLFNNPELRTFTFSFKLSPRSRTEAQKVKQIIRTFKQSMSVKRSKTSFLLKTPDTYIISYIFQNKQHPYMNRFKECALTNCSVDYTPEGNYMSFDDSEHPSMVSYQLDLTFQELEPLYDDEYGSDYDNIGF